MAGNVERRRWGQQPARFPARAPALTARRASS